MKKLAGLVLIIAGIVIAASVNAALGVVVAIVGLVLTWSHEGGK